MRRFLHDDDMEDEMKASGIKFDGTSYAYSTSDGYSRGGVFVYSSRTEVTIIGREAVRHWRARGDVLVDGWRVKNVADGHEFVVPSRHIRSTWADWLIIKGDAVEQAAKETAMNALATRLGVPIPVSESVRGDELLTLLVAVEAAVLERAADRLIDYRDTRSGDTGPNGFWRRGVEDAARQIRPSA